MSLESEVGKGSIFSVRLPWEFHATEGVSSALSEKIQELGSTLRVDTRRHSYDRLDSPSSVPLSPDSLSNESD